ncbi:MAG: dTDP-4-dehydrorhamnose 3,5-epimerase [Planctomycetaceae bacterium]|nr:dTDP-4-dehydrorhamnose 3,5-epimerase [Planctomycetaceae bacterium]
MKFESTPISGVTIVELQVFGDDRGFFTETYQQRRFADAGIAAPFVQDNHSRSTAGVLRGLHFQIEQPQGKLIQVLRGEIYDVAVDLRRSSPTFGKWFGIRLGEAPRRLLYVPPGCAHGFYVISGPADVCYKCTDFYAPQHERTLLWNDPELGIDWPLTGAPVVSGKDQQGLPLSRCATYA